jgi:hypothetical protein
VAEARPLKKVKSRADEEEGPVEKDSASQAG